MERLLEQYRIQGNTYLMMAKVSGELHYAKKARECYCKYMELILTIIKYR